MSQTERRPWPGDWEGLSREQRRAWQRMSAEQRLRWLEEALTFAAEAGALTRDRDERARAASKWEPLSAPRHGLDHDVPEQPM